MLWIKMDLFCYVDENKVVTRIESTKRQNFLRFYLNGEVGLISHSCNY